MKPVRVTSRGGRVAIAGLAIGAVTLSGAIFPSLLGSIPPASASTNSLLSQPTLGALAAAANTAGFPSGSSRAVVVPSASAAVVAQGAALAAKQGIPLVVSDSSTSASDTIAKLAALHATSVDLIGLGSSFTSSFTTALSGSVTVTTSILNSDDEARSIAIAQASAFSHIVIVDTGHPTEMVAGANYAALDGDALILTNSGSLSSQPLKTFLTSFTAKTKTIIGSAQPIGSLIADDQLETTDFVDVSDLAQATQDIASRVVNAGNTANDVYVAPPDQLGSVAINGLLARQKHAISLIAGPSTAIDDGSSAKSYLTLWGNETANVHLVGLGLTTAQATAVATPTLATRSAAPTFRPTALTPGSSTWTLSYTPISGVASYTAYDLWGTNLGSSTTSSIVMPNPITAIVLVANDAAGNEVKRFDYRVNTYAGTGSDSQESAVMSSTYGGTNYLQFLGSLKVPRFITRIMTDPFSMEGSPVVTLLGITCAANFTDAGQDATKQYEYDVQTMSVASNRACDPAASQTPSSTAPIQAAQIDVPLTEFPSFPEVSKSADVTRSSLRAAGIARAASPTAMDVGLMNATAHTSEKSNILADMIGISEKGTARATLPDYLIRYMGFIPEGLVPVPGYPTLNSFYPQTAVAGDGRSEFGYDPAGSFRFRADVSLNFSNNTVGLTRKFGESIRYNCTLFFGSCNVVQRKTAPESEIQMVSSSINSSGATFRIVTHATIPVIVPAPAIDSDLTIHLSAGNSYIVGGHDRMPVHEIYDGPQNSEFFVPPAYHSNGHFVPCLFGIGNDCRVKVNVHP